MMRDEGQIEPNEERLEDGIAFAGVAKFPARVVRSTVGWSAAFGTRSSKPEREQLRRYANDRHSQLPGSFDRSARADLDRRILVADDLPG